MLAVTSLMGSPGQPVLIRIGEAVVHVYAPVVSLLYPFRTYPGMHRTNWYAPMLDNDHRNGGCAIIPYISNGQQTEYCCDGIVSNGSKAVCAHGQDSFKLTNGAAITGRAYLAKESVTGKGNNKKDVAIGAGVGVPLGVLFLTAFGWALYERKKRYSLLNSPAVASAQPVQPMQPVQPVQPMQPEYGHLGAKSVASREMQATVPLQELGTSDGRKPQELDGRYV